MGEDSVKIRSVYIESTSRLAYSPILDDVMFLMREADVSQRRLWYVIIMVTALTGLNPVQASRIVTIDGYPVVGSRPTALAVRFMKVRLWEDAEAELRKLLEKRPDDHYAWYNLGVVCEHKGDVSSARTYYQRAQSIQAEEYIREALIRLDNRDGLIGTIAPIPSAPPPIIPVHPLASNPSFNPSEKTMRVRSPSAMLYPQPSHMVNTMATLNQGETVVLLEMSSEWAHVRLSDSTQGWVPVDMLEESEQSTRALRALPMPENPEMATMGDAPNPPQTPLPSTLSSKSMQIKDNGVDVAVLSEPTLLADVLYTMHPGTKVEVLDQPKPNWYRIQTSKGLGYMLSAYLEEIP